MSVFDQMQKRRAAGLTNYGGKIGRVAKSDSAESDQMQLTVTGEGDAPQVRHPQSGKFLPASDPRVTEMVKSAPAQVKAAVKVLRSPKSNGHEHLVASSVVNGWAGKEGNGGDAQTPGVEGPRLNGAASADDVGVVGGTVDQEYVAKMRRALADPNISAADAEVLGERLTHDLLAASHAPAPGALSKATLTPVGGEGPIARLRELVKSKDLDPTLRQEVGALLTRHDLSKGVIEDQMSTAQNVNSALAATGQAQATAASIRAYQASNTHAPQPVQGVDSSGQLATIGSGLGRPQSLGAASQVGNRGDLTGAQGKIEGEPLALVIERAEDELQKATSTLDRQRLGEIVTFLKLKAARTGGLVAA